MEDSANPGDHGLIRTDFPGGWITDKSNAFTGKNLEDSQKEMQNYLKKLLNFRKNSKAIHKGKTLHFAPNNGIYLLSRIFEDEIVIFIVNKNDKSVNLDTVRFEEINAGGKTFIDIQTNKRIEWKDEIELESNSSMILSTKI